MLAYLKPSKGPASEPPSRLRSCPEQEAPASGGPTGLVLRQDFWSSGTRRRAHRSGRGLPASLDRLLHRSAKRVVHLLLAGAQTHFLDNQIVCYHGKP